jgi:ABC-type lipoprotein release transport system permease subunit
MAIPLKYNLRNVVVRWITAGMTAVGIAAVITIFVMLFAMGIGMEKTLVETGNPLNMIVLRKGATETTSGMDREKVADIAALDGIAKDAQGEPMISAELVVVANHPKAAGQKANLALRGVGPRARELRGNIKLIKGEWFKPGLGELVAGKGATERFKDLKVGDRPFIRGRTWTVVGLFEAAGQAYESEVWGDIDDLKTQFKREFSSVIVRVKRPEDRDLLTATIQENKRIQLEAKPHAAYYKDQNMGAQMMKAMGFIIGLVLSIGAIFGAANTMYAAVASRKREIATLRVLGFGSASIWFSFMLEAAFLGLAGGVLGSLLAFVVFDGMTSGTANWETFSELAFQFRVTPMLMLIGVVLAVLMGVMGGFLPAWRASRTTIAQALREL